MGKSETKVSSGGIGFTGALTIAFVVLKLLGKITWSWVWVLSPIWISAGLTIIILGIWRDELAYTIRECNVNWTVFNPSLHISDTPEFGMSEREAMNYDLYHLLRSDLVIMNFSYNARSVGSIIELGIAYDHKIPVIGLNETNEELHPWQSAMCLRIFHDYNKMVDYIVDHFINEK